MDANVTYTAGRDTTINDFYILCLNHNIDDKYAVQIFYIDYTTLIQNHYPELISTIEIEAPLQ